MPHKILPYDEESKQYANPKLKINNLKYLIKLHVITISLRIL